MPFVVSSTIRYKRATTFNRPHRSSPWTIFYVRTFLYVSYIRDPIYLTKKQKVIFTVNSPWKYRFLVLSTIYKITTTTIFEIISKKVKVLQLRFIRYVFRVIRYCRFRGIIFRLFYGIQWRVFAIIERE